jgi:DNA-binding transcriptional ArsR family regulator
MDKEVNLFKALSDPVRLRLVFILAGGGEMCVCKLVEATDEPQFKISRHLGILRHAGLVESRREGTWMYYRLLPTNTLLDDYFLESGSSYRACLPKKSLKTSKTRCHVQK